MGDEVERRLENLLRTAATIRCKLDDLAKHVAEVDEQLKQLAILRPDVSLMLVSDVHLRQRRQSAEGLCSQPAVTIGIRLPGGVGLVVWRDLPSLQNGDGRHSVDGEPPPNFLPFNDVSPVLRRLLIPHLESVLDGLRQRMIR